MDAEIVEDRIGQLWEYRIQWREAAEYGAINGGNVFGGYSINVNM